LLLPLILFLPILGSDLPVEVQVQSVEVETRKTEREEIEDLIRETFPEDPDRALAIANCESNLNPNAWSPTHDGGVFQIHVPVHEERLTELGLDIWDPEDNVRFARLLYEERGWRPWVCNDLI
jgi:hypothetical protein